MVLKAEPFFCNNENSPEMLTFFGKNENSPEMWTFFDREKVVLRKTKINLKCRPFLWGKKYLFYRKKVVLKSFFCVKYKWSSKSQTLTFFHFHGYMHIFNQSDQSIANSSLSCPANSKCHKIKASIMP